MADDVKETVTKEQYDAVVAERDAAKAHNGQLFKEAKTAKDALKNYDGVDPTRYKQLEDAAAEAERKRAAGEGDWKALEGQLTKKLTDTESAAKVREQALLGSLGEVLVDREAISELAKHSDSPRLLLPHVKKHMRMVEQDGKFVARIVDGDGNVRIGKGSGSEPMTLAELIDEMKGEQDFAPAFKGSGSSGGGASRSTAGGGGVVTRMSRRDPNAFKGENLKKISDGTLILVD